MYHSAVYLFYIFTRILKKIEIDFLFTLNLVLMLSFYIIMACSSKQEISMATIKFIILILHSDPPSHE